MIKVIGQRYTATPAGGNPQIMPQPTLRLGQPGRFALHRLQSGALRRHDGGMDDPRRNLIRTAIENYADPFLGETLGASRAVDEVVLREGRVSVRLRFGFPVGGYADELAEPLRAQIEPVAGGLAMDLELVSQIQAHAVQRSLKPVPGVKH